MRPRPADVARAYAPVLRWFLGAAACYYALISVSHAFAETGTVRMIMLSLSLTGCLIPLLGWRHLRRTQNVSLRWLEIVAGTTYALFLLNVATHQLLAFRPERLVYFVYMAMVFGVTAPTLRVAYAAIALALAGMAAFGYRTGSDFLDIGAFVGLAGGFAAVGMATIMRGVVMREIRARLLSESLLVEAKSAVRAKSSFMATISHEFRTPLNGILGMVQIMRGDHLPTIQAERLDVVERDADALRELLDDTLEIIGLEAGEMTARADAFDLQAFAHGLNRLFRAKIESKGLAFDLEVVDVGQGRCVTDEGRLRQVAANLISNALKFTSRGSVHVSLEASRDELVLTVGDTGVGIPATALARIFEPFTQLDDSITRMWGGVGLGLAICRQTVSLLGGTIDVESTPDFGSSFTVRLPITRAEDDGGGEAATPPHTEGACRALVVDDNPTNRLVLSTLLGSLGVDCEVAENGLEAVDAYATGDWDAVFMDIHMPQMDGMTAARAIRKQEARRGRPPTPIIAVTASVLPEDIARYGAAGMDVVIPKPISLSDLAAALETARSRPPLPNESSTRIPA